MKSDKLYDLLKTKNIFSLEEIDSIVHALVDIEESINNVYKDFIPKILSKEDISNDELREHIWSIREEFRHIDYHIHDAKLLDI